MKTKTFILNLNDETAEVIRTIALCIPCFITLNTMCGIDNAGEYTICAREYDWAWIERKLATIV